MKDSTAPTVDQQRLVRVIRCQDCKHAFDEPEDSEGRTPQPCEDIICPGCHRRKMRLWYVEVNQLIDGKWKTVPDANTLVSDPEPATSTSKVANPKDSLHQPVVLGMGSKTILPEGH